ncbi:PREDICTED: uncharacterized protein LOC105567764 [Vollenhovia emeryi]|uniref:uncharacterized protein LOC105567764 n=1 Tax=Vollenhovia emeryi TaxID=411798 RepID=UPI0005F3A047|nr:PREDICTED: uncharacterized protein LOC105567764 [Vollenhovia emeryi]
MVRFKNRYIVFTIQPHDGGDDKQAAWKNTHVSNAIKRKVQQLYGDVGTAAIRDGFDAKYCNAQTKIAIVRLRHGPHKFALHAIPLINDVGERRVRTRILHVAATLKHCFLFVRVRVRHSSVSCPRLVDEERFTLPSSPLQKYQEQTLEQLWSKLPTEAERRRMEVALMTLTPATRDLT